MIRRTRVEVDLAAIVGNARAVALYTRTALYAVVKADAYGHGAIAVAQALERARAANGLCVSLVEEGVALRDAGVKLPILVMGPSQLGGEDEMIARGLMPVISSREELAALAAIARRGAANADGRGYVPVIEAHLKIDTGMSRLGVAVESAAELAQDAARAGVRIVGVMTHFACADSDDPDDEHSMTRAQLARFALAERAVVAAGAPVRVRHAANSSGALLYPTARMDLVRCGLAIYGNGSWALDRPTSNETLPVARTQAMRLVTAIAQLRVVPSGTTVGYGATWRAPRDSTLAVLPCGYADGLPRRASGHAQCAIRGRRAPLVGLISMDIAVADVTEVPGASVGDAAVLLGRASDGTSIATSELATWSGLSEYEVTCGMSKRVPRVYLEAA
jgi:alanine racemase